MFKHLLWILPFFVLQIVIEPYCYCFECCFYINQAPFSIFSWDVQSSTSTLGCNIFCMFNSLRVFVSIFFTPKIFQSMMPKLYCTTGTARLLIASILFLPLNSYNNNNNYYHYSFLPSFLILLHSRMAKIKFGLGHVLKLIKL